MNSIKLCDLGYEPYEVVLAVREYYIRKGAPYTKMSFVNCLSHDGLILPAAPDKAVTQIEFNEEGITLVRLLML